MQCSHFELYTGHIVKPYCFLIRNEWVLYYITIQNNAEKKLEMITKFSAIINNASETKMKKKIHNIM